MASFKNKVLIVDNDSENLTAVKKHLRSVGFDVLSCNSIKDGLEIIYSHSPDVILIDLNLSDGDGGYLVSNVRKWALTPIVVMSARNSERDVVNAFNLGCDDYVIKPIRLNELTARINSALKRVPLTDFNRELALTQKVSVGKVTIDFSKHKVYVEKNGVSLTPNEFRIIALLAKHVGQVVGYKQLIHELWGPTAGLDTRILRVHVTKIRKKIAAFDSEKKYIHTESGIGYMLDGE